LWKKKRLREHNHYGKFHRYSGSGERERERERGLGFGAHVLVCFSVLAASFFFPAICIAGAAEDGAEDR
jgi:dolichol kinase